MRMEEEVTIESQLIATLQNRVKDGRTKDRDIELIAYHFGFRGHPQPRVEDTGREFDITKQNVSKIITEKFRTVVSYADMPAIAQTYQVMKEREYWHYSELAGKLVEYRLAGDSFYIEGIFRLMDAVGFQNEYNIYTPELQRQSRRHAAEGAECFVIDSTVVDRIRPLYGRVRRLPGKYGIARLDYLDDGSQEYSVYRGLIRDLLKSSNDAWVDQRDSELWYLFEEFDDNPLINFSKKVFSIAGRVNTQELATAYHNALRGRSQSRDFPDEETLSRFLMSSKRFERYGDQVEYIGQRDHRLNPIEQDVVAYLEANGPSKFADIRKRLEGLGYLKPAIVKAVMRSPLVYVDRSGGKNSHMYSLPESSASDDQPSRYVLTRRRLIALRSTDALSVVKVRTEQGILRDWLFGDKASDSCAVCGKDYPINALVAAHKKKRRDCSEVERLDPHIVMPLCLFGCDYLYEHRHVRVEDGVIVIGEQFEDEGAGEQYRRELVGRTLGKGWWENGSSSYFQ